MAIYISGSLAFDRIMNFPGGFEDHILPDKLKILNVSFLIDGLVERRGGTAGNIAYTLSLLDEKPYILASAGRDFAEYSHYLGSLGLPLEGVRRIPSEHTASCYLITDKSNNQINAFHPAAMKFSCDFAFASTGHENSWAIVSPGNLDDMRGLPKKFRELGIPYIYDPGQQIPALSGDDLLDGIAGSNFMVSNDYELEMVCKSTQKTRAEIRQLTKCLITTLGDQGSIVHTTTMRTIDIAKANVVVDPTGAGDAYRAGLLKGLTLGFDPVRSAYLGATCSSFCVECQGTQEHTFDKESFAKRYEAAFGEAPFSA